VLLGEQKNQHKKRSGDLQANLTSTVLTVKPIVSNFASLVFKQIQVTEVSDKPS